MTKKQFEILRDEYTFYGDDSYTVIGNGVIEFPIYDDKEGTQALCDLLNNYEDENEQLKQEKQHTISYLKEHYDYANKQRQNYLNNPLLAKAYDIIRHDIRQLALNLGVDLND